MSVEVDVMPEVTGCGADEPMLRERIANGGAQ